MDLEAFKQGDFKGFFSFLTASSVAIAVLQAAVMLIVVVVVVVVRT